MQKSKDTNESNWKTATRRNKRNNRPDNRPDNRPPGNQYEGGTVYNKQDKWSRRPDRNKSGRNWEQSIIKNTKKNTEKNEYTSQQPIYNGPNFSKLIQTDESAPNESDRNTENTEYSSIVDYHIPKLVKRFRPSVRNQVPRTNTNNSYDTWEFTYFKHILDLHSIFANAIHKLGIPGIDTNSYNFLYVFGKFIRECSSGEISPYIEDLTERDKQVYMEYTIKRNKS